MGSGAIGRPKRVEVDVPVSLEGEGGSFVASLRNIGPGGVFVVSHTQFRVGERMVLRFQLSDQERSISVTAEVCWVPIAGDLGPGAGLRFVGPSVEAMTAIEEFRRRHDEDVTPSWPST